MFNFVSLGPLPPSTSPACARNNPNPDRMRSPSRCPPSTTTAARSASSRSASPSTLSCTTASATSRTTRWAASRGPSYRSGARRSSRTTTGGGPSRASTRAAASTRCLPCLALTLTRTRTLSLTRSRTLNRTHFALAVAHHPQARPGDPAAGRLWTSLRLLAARCTAAYRRGRGTGRCDGRRHAGAPADAAGSP